MTRFHVIIPTYNRPERLARVIDDLLMEAFHANVSVQIHVYDDGSDPPAMYDHGQVTVHRRAHGGKRQWWALVGDALRDAHFYHKGQWDYLLFLPDDVRLLAGFFTEAARTWHAITDAKRVMLGLMVDERAGKLQWVQRHPKLVRFGETEVWLQHWNDMCFLAGPRMLSMLRGKIIPIDERHWKDLPRRSSGVGRQISRRLHSMGGHIYNVTDTLVYHGNHESQMHPASDPQKRKRPVAL